MFYNKKMYLDGKLSEGSDHIEVFNPATEEMTGKVAGASILEAEKSLESAKRSLTTWPRTSISERQHWMHCLRKEIIANEQSLRECVHFEIGKPWQQTKEDFESLKNSLEFYSQEIARFNNYSIPDRTGSHSHLITYEPVGVVVAFISWNFPLLNLAFKLGPALASGCPIIIRPSELSPISAYAVGEICSKIALPPGVVQIFSSNSYDVADYLSSSKIPSLITLIGSSTTGRHVMQKGATSIKRYSMELGGNAPALVLYDADLALAANTIAALKFSNAGQICVAPNRIFVDSKVYEDFKTHIVGLAETTEVGFDKNSDIHTGPVINQKSWIRLKKLVDDAVMKGAQLLIGGDRPSNQVRGHFFSPTILSGVTDQMQIYHEEIFGPIISLISFNDEKDLTERSNLNNDGGLVAYVFTDNEKKAELIGRELHFGEIQINGVKYDIDLPHGGIGQSGFGHDCSKLALNDYHIVKRISKANKYVS